MKKIGLLVASLLSIFLVACSNQKSANGKLNVVTTFYPVYEFTKQVAGQNHINMSLLLRLSQRFKMQILSFMKMKTWKLGCQNCLKP